MTDHEHYRAVAERLWPDVRRAFNYPLLRDVGLTDPDGTADPAPVRWADDRVVLSTTHLDALNPDESDVEWLVDALLKHEVGHYALFPRELARHLRYLQRAEEAFGEERGYGFYALYADVCNELRLLRSHIGGTEVLDHRERILEATTADDGGGGDSANTSDGHSADVGGSDVARERRRRFQRLVLALYDATFENLSSSVTLQDREHSVLNRLLEIDYFTEDPDRHERNVVRFGHALEAALSDLPDGTLLGLGSPEDRGKTGHERPFAGDELHQIPEAELDRALSDALEADRWSYDRLKRFLERRADFEDPHDPERGGAAGLDRGDIERHDDEVAVYRRWAADFPVYVADAPIETDETALYRSGRRAYETGDPLRRIDPFASLGLVGVPGVSAVHEFAEGVVPAEERGVPDLLIRLDSSGSMPRPSAESHAILAAFVLAATYRRNGAAVGGYNFSGGVAFVPPSRDRDALHSLLCARWGGGTVLDRDALTRFVDRMDSMEGVTFAEEVAHEDVLDRELGTDDREAASDDPATIDDPVVDDSTTTIDAPAAFAGLDHVLITDGDIANEEAVIAFIERVSERGRAIVLLTEAANHERWADRDLDALVYAATDESDLLNLAIGLASDRARNAEETNESARAGNDP